MPKISINGREFDVDNKGFLKDPSIWDEDVASLFAIHQGIDTLTASHWTVLNFIRSYFDRAAEAPMIRQICQETGYSLAEVYNLFSEGPLHGACKIAGLPKPEGCV